MKTSDRRKEQPSNWLLKNFLPILEKNTADVRQFADLIPHFLKIPVNTWGTVYEEFRKTCAEERKADGVYYTPEPIVDFIIENTVGKLCEGKTPAQVAGLKIIDPACGCGVFLIRAYQYLLNWHRDKYIEEYQAKGTEPKGLKTDTLNRNWQLTASEKKKILLNNIYGVDIDMIAVEMTKLSLLIKCVEGETNASIEITQKIFHEKVLPNIDSNIVAGNSLVDTDFYELDFDPQDEKKIKPMNWQHHFPAAMKQGGFDAVIGNPPWGQKAAKFDKIIRQYYAAHYPASMTGILDLFRFFIERALQLIPGGGLYAQVLPDIVLLKNYETTRKLILDTLTLRHIVHWGTPFAQCNIEVCTLIGKKESFGNKKTKNVRVVIHRKKQNVETRKMSQNVFRQLQGSKFNILLTEETLPLLQKWRQLRTFKEFFTVHEGIHTGNARELLFVPKKTDKHCRKLIFGRDEVQRYRLQWGGQWVHYTKDDFGKKQYANLGRKEFFETPKLIIRRTGDFVLACIDEENYYVSNNVFICLPKENSIDLYFFLGLLNSSLITWYYRNAHPQVGQLFPEIKINLINDFPVPDFQADSKTGRAIAKLAAQLVALYNEKADVRVSPQLYRIEEKIAYSEDKINALVYELYGLTKEEVVLVKGK
ncbi:MAG: N-6 DNA methylase [Planctomycetaceae bacterium]|jgi:type I restriction-modification system DNA methylase subunit|nr:N-6 DNA methylase [Planctomycetaceae bacterium]